MTLPEKQKTEELPTVPLKEKKVFVGRGREWSHSQSHPVFFHKCSWFSKSWSPWKKEMKRSRKEDNFVLKCMQLKLDDVAWLEKARNWDLATRIKLQYLMSWNEIKSVQGDFQQLHSSFPDQLRPQICSRDQKLSGFPVMRGENERELWGHTHPSHSQE